MLYILIYYRATMVSFVHKDIIDIFGHELGAYENASCILFFLVKNTRPRTLHYCDTMHCINAITLIIAVILSPPREAHYPDLPPFAHVFHITYILRVAYICH